MDNDYYPHQHTAYERLSIMQDLEASKRVAETHGDEARQYYTQEAINALNHGE
jgi:hypothetical protein